MIEKVAQEFLPENAKCVFEGILFDVYQWEQELFDKSTTTFEAVVRRGSVQIIYVNEDNTITLFEETQPHIGKFISLPGGQIDEGERPKDAAKRELLEEMGVASENMILWKSIIPMKKLIWPTYYYIVKNGEKIQEPRLDAGEKINTFNVSFEDFLNYLENPEFRNKQLSDIIFRLKQDESQLEKFKELLFSD